MDKFKVFMSLTQGKVAIIDYEDYKIVTAYKWFAHKRGGKYYASTNYKKGNAGRKALHMHRIIIKCPSNLEVDHIDGNTLNNCKDNLRVCTHQENMFNSKLSASNKSGCKGVSFYKKTNKWVAYIHINDKMVHLGYFKTLEEASNKSKIARKRHHKGFYNEGR